MASSGPVLRIFEVQVKDGHVEELHENFATTSSKVWKGIVGLSAALGATAAS